VIEGRLLNNHITDNDSESERQSKCRRMAAEKTGYEPDGSKATSNPRWGPKLLGCCTWVSIREPFLLLSLASFVPHAEARLRRYFRGLSFRALDMPRRILQVFFSQINFLPTQLTRLSQDDHDLSCVSTMIGRAFGVSASPTVKSWRRDQIT